MISNAVISDCKMYRYWLKRVWDEKLPMAIYVMLNPSTADATENDQTIRLCMSWARKLGRGGIGVVNLFSYRSTYPHELLSALSNGVDMAVGPDTEAYYKAAIEAFPNALYIAAWGNYGHLVDRGRQVSKYFEAAGAPLHCIGVTKDGSPRHPLRVPYSNPVERWHGYP